MEVSTNPAEQLKRLRVQLLMRLIIKATVMHHYTVLCMACNNVVGAFFFFENQHFRYIKQSIFFQCEFSMKMLKLFKKISIRVVKQRFFNFYMNSCFLSSKRWLLCC